MNMKIGSLKEHEQELLSKMIGSPVYFAASQDKIKMFAERLKQSRKTFFTTSNNEEQTAIIESVLLDFLALLNYDIVRSESKLKHQIDEAFLQFINFEKDNFLDLTDDKTFLSECLTEIIYNRDGISKLLSERERKLLAKYIMKTIDNQSAIIEDIEQLKSGIKVAILKNPQNNPVIADYIQAVQYCLAHDSSVKNNRTLNSQFKGLLKILNSNEPEDEILKNFHVSMQLLDNQNATDAYLFKLSSKKNDESELRKEKIAFLKKLQDVIKDVKLTDNYLKKQRANSAFNNLLKTPTVRKFVKQDSGFVTFIKTLGTIAATIVGFGVGGYFAYQSLFGKNTAEDKRFLQKKNLSISQKIKTARRIINHTAVWLPPVIR